MWYRVCEKQSAISMWCECDEAKQLDLCDKENLNNQPFMRFKEYCDKTNRMYRCDNENVENQSAISIWWRECEKQPAISMWWSEGDEVEVLNTCVSSPSVSTEYVMEMWFSL